MVNEVVEVIRIFEKVIVASQRLWKSGRECSHGISATQHRFKRMGFRMIIQYGIAGKHGSEELGRHKRTNYAEVTPL